MHEPTASLRERTGRAVRASPPGAWTRRAWARGAWTRGAWTGGAWTGGAWARRARGLAAALIAAVFLSVSGAFGSGEAPFVQRLLYWAVTMIAGGLIGGLAAELADRRGWAEERPWLRGLAITAAVAAPLVVLVWAATPWWFGRPLRLGALPGYVVPVVLVSGLMTAANFALNRRPVETHAAGAGAPEPAFLRRLPPKLRGGELHAVEAEDHYLRLHTSRGSDLILMRLSDALGELEGLEGAQTHRSWWVARAAVAEARRGDGRATLRLNCGVEAPVSRTYAKALREAGWF